MARRSATQNKYDVSSLKIFKNPKVAFAFGLIFVDALLVALIINYVPYTKIDWDAYMSQVSGFLEGERDYSNLKGDTGPLVYPAGFLYVYSAIQYITGGEVYSAQILFGILYIINLAIVLFIYVKTNVLPWWALTLLCLSKRVHSIFVLRLFNDCFAMTFLNAALALFLYQKWHLGLIVFSAAVSVKMNVLLYAPPLLLLLFKSLSISGVISALAGAALVQILLGLPFLISHPIAYVSRAFNLGRVFIHFWYLLLGFMVWKIVINLNIHIWSFSIKQTMTKSGFFLFHFLDVDKWETGLRFCCMIVCRHNFFLNIFAFMYWCLIQAIAVSSLSLSGSSFLEVSFIFTAL